MQLRICCRDLRACAFFLRLASGAGCLRRSTEDFPLCVTAPEVLPLARLDRQWASVRLRCRGPGWQITREQKRQGGMLCTAPATGHDSQRSSIKQVRQKLGKTRKAEESEKNEFKANAQQISSRLQAKTCGLPWAGTQFVGVLQPATAATQRSKKEKDEISYSSSPSYRPQQ